MDQEKAETKVIWIAALIQFVHITDFMMVMPLGPDFAKHLNIASSQIGYIGGIYTLAAAVSGLLCVRWLDRFDRKRAAMITVTCLTLSTFIATLSWIFHSLLAARALAGLFGGPAVSIAMACVIDTVPKARRGRAMSIVIGAFSAAAIFGVPIGVQLAEINWRMPFYTVASVGALLLLVIWKLFPKISQPKQEQASIQVSLISLLTKKQLLLGYIALGLTFYSAFLLIPNFSAYFQYNLGFPREYIGLLYLAGGCISLITMRIAGVIIDRSGTLPLSILSAAILAVAIWDGFTHTPYLSVFVVFVLFMASSSTRRLAVTAITSHLPASHERAGFMSLLTAIQHGTSGMAALTSSCILGVNQQALTNMSTLAWLSITIVIIQPIIIWLLTLQTRKNHNTALVGC